MSKLKKFGKVVVDLRQDDGSWKPVEMTDMKKEDYEDFLHFMETLSALYGVIVQRKNVKQ